MITRLLRTGLIFFTLLLVGCESSPNLENEAWGVFNPKEFTGQDMFTTISVRFIGDDSKGTVEIYQVGIRDISLKSCVTTGNYIYNSNVKTLTIHGIYNLNCPYMEVFNGAYTFYKSDGVNYLEKDDIQIVS